MAKAKSKCRTCGDSFSGPSPDHVTALIEGHYNDTGHRRFNNLQGMREKATNFPPHPKHEPAADAAAEDWTHPTTLPPGVLTEAELMAHLAPLATKKELAAVQKNVATRHDIDAMRAEVGQRLKAFEHSGPGGSGLRAEVEDALKRAAAKMKDLEKVEPRVRSLEDWKHNAREVLDRVKELHRDGVRVEDPRVQGILERLENTEESVVSLMRVEAQNTAAVVSLVWRVFERVYAPHHGTPTYADWKMLEKLTGIKLFFGPNGAGPKTPVTADPDEFEGLGVPPPAPPEPGDPTEARGSVVLEKGDGKPVARMPVPDIAKDKRVSSDAVMAFLIDGAHRLHLNSAEAVRWAAEHFDVPRDYPSALVTVGLFEGWLEKEKRAARSGPQGGGRPKVVLVGAEFARAQIKDHTTTKHVLKFVEEVEGVVA